MIEFKRLDDDIKRNDVGFSGLDIKMLKEKKFEGNVCITLPNRGIFGKDSGRITIYLDMSGVSMYDLYVQAGEQLKTRATQSEVKNMSETQRAKVLKDGFMVVKVADWFVEKAVGKTVDPMSRAKAAMNKLSTKERAELIAALTESE